MGSEEGTASGAPVLEIRGDAGIYVAEWQDLHVRVDHIAEDKRSLSAEFTFTTKGHPAPVTDRCNMVASLGKKRLATMLENGLGLLDAREFVEALCQSIMERHRAGEPLYRIPTGATIPPLSFLLRPLLLAHHPTLLFAEQGKGKTLLATLLGIMVQHSHPALGLTPGVSGNVAYWDYEGDADSFTRNALALWRGLGRTGEPAIAYRRMTRRLVEDIDVLRLMTLEERLCFGILDTGPRALQADADKHFEVNALYDALRYLKIAVLILTHTSKAREQIKTALGSMEWDAQARESYELASVSQDNALTLALYHRKHNYRAPLPPWGLKFEFERDANDGLASITAKRTDVMVFPELTEKMGYKERIAAELRRGTATVEQIAEQTGIESGAVRLALNRNRAVFIQGTGSPPTWGLIAPKNEAPDREDDEPF